MSDKKKPTYFDMLYHIVEELTANNPDIVMHFSQISDKVEEKFGKQNKETLRRVIIAATVNMDSRVNWWFNKKPRIAETVSERDLLYSMGLGTSQYVKYDPEKSLWQIRLDESTNEKIVEKVVADGDWDDPPPEKLTAPTFALESHLRDYLAKNLSTLTIHGKNLELVSTEYPTEVGPIDILAKDNEGNFYVFELKLSKGVDKALGQILRYMGWIKKEESNGKSVSGIIVAEKIDDKLKYAIQAVNNVDLFEYEVNFTLKSIDSKQS